jgi:hypothetical protein
MPFRFDRRAFRVPFGITAALLLTGGAAMSILVLDRFTPEKPGAVVSERLKHSAPPVPTVAMPARSTAPYVPPEQIVQPAATPGTSTEVTSVTPSEFHVGDPEAAARTNVTFRSESDPGLGEVYLRIYNTKTGEISAVGPYPSFDQCESTRVAMDRAGSFPTRCDAR